MCRLFRCNQITMDGMFNSNFSDDFLISTSSYLCKSSKNYARVSWGVCNVAVSWNSSNLLQDSWPARAAVVPVIKLCLNFGRTCNTWRVDGFVVTNPWWLSRCCCCCAQNHFENVSNRETLLGVCVQHKYEIVHTRFDIYSPSRVNSPSSFVAVEILEHLTTHTHTHRCCRSAEQNYGRFRR